MHINFFITRLQNLIECFFPVEIFLVSQQPSILAYFFQFQTPVLENFNNDLHDEYGHREVQKERHEIKNEEFLEYSTVRTKFIMVIFLIEIVSLAFAVTFTESFLDLIQTIEIVIDVEHPVFATHSLDFILVKQNYVISFDSDHVCVL